MGRLGLRPELDVDAHLEKQPHVGRDGGGGIQPVACPVDDEQRLGAEIDDVHLAFD